MDDYRIMGPAVISFSGGRTSGYMLRLILDAYQGKLPDDVRVIFTNTGREMPETLDFVDECSARWGVPITWLEYRAGGRYVVVNYEKASRDGEPFAAVITDRNFLPNPVARICTVELKVLTMVRYVTAEMGWPFFTNVVGIRADEPKRVAKLGDSARKEFGRYAPLALAGIVAADVGKFWSGNDFDLRLPNLNGKTAHGNCDLCFLKGLHQKVSLIREQPSRAKWWIEQERRVTSKGQIDGDAGLFRMDQPSYADMHRFATSHDEMFPFPENDLQDCACTD